MAVRTALRPHVAVALWVRFIFVVFAVGIWCCVVAIFLAIVAVWWGLRLKIDASRTCSGQENRGGFAKWY
jgi:hypothetical protein